MPRKAKPIPPSITLPPGLLAQAHAAAVDRGQTLDAYVADAVALHLGQPTAADVATLIAAAPLIGESAEHR